MIAPNLNFRIVLALLFIHYAFLGAVHESSNENIEFRSKFPVAEERRLKRNAETKHRLATTKNQKRDLNKRQSFCFGGNLQCTSSSYRTFDGTCNNLNNTFWGSAGIPYTRYLPAVYEDGYQRPRGLFRNWPTLPRSRDISVQMTNTFVPSRPDNVSLMLMQWGQFIDHDLVSTTNDAVGGIYSGSSCCDDFMDTMQTSPSCLPIDVTGDWFYSSFGVNCLPFVRSSDSFCWPQREQRNDATSYMDASQIYGCHEWETMELKDQTTPWKLKISSGTGECNVTCPFTFLPVRNNSNGTEEFFTGDRRVEEQPGLTSMHTAFLRMHNDLGQLYKIKNTNASDVKVFQEIRKIIGASLQCITYGEFLPLVIGIPKMNSCNLLLQNINLSTPTFNGYNVSVDASASNVFATAAFRYGHSMVPDLFTMPSGSLVDLRFSFNKHDITTVPGTFPSHFLRGIAAGFSEEMDHKLSDAVQNWLLAKPGANFGSDLYSLNIERGRDHGLAEYIEWANTCRCLPKAISRFHELNQLMPQETVDALSMLYGGRIRDIDLFPAAIAEYNVPGGVVGPTFACILGEYFWRLKVGDRYWFENPGVFTVAQLKSIRNTKLSSIICRYTDATQVQENVFLPPSPSNPLKSCTELRLRGIFTDIKTNW